MQKIILGIFKDEDDVQNALGSLEKHGFNPKDLSIVMKDRKVAERIEENTSVNVVENTATGAATGGALGALAGLLIGVGAIAIPGLGAVLIGGPIAAALGLGGAAATTVSGAATGALAGGLIGALTSFGVPEDQARIYEESINTGGILVAVPAVEREIDLVEEILDANGADQIRSISTSKEYTRRSDLNKDDQAYRYR